MSDKAAVFKRLALVGVMLAITGAAGAQQAPISYVNEVNARKANVELIKAQIEEARAKSDLAQLQYKIEQLGRPDTSATSSKSEGESAAAKTSASQLDLDAEPAPDIMAIFGSNGKLYASLRFKNGLIQDVRPGDRIDGGFRVKSVSTSKVTLTRDGKSYTLKTYGGSNQDVKIPSNSSQSTLPGGRLTW